MLAGFDADGAGTSGNRFEGGVLEMLPVPLPKDFVYGVDMQKRDFERKAWSYLRGEWRMGGWWYYYAYAVMIKVPLGTWVLILMGLVSAVLCREYRTSWRNELFLLLPGIAVFLLVSSQTGLNHHMRYVLSVFPFLFIWGSRVARSIALEHRAVAAIATIALAWSVVSSLWIYPHSLSYFNESTGGPTRGHFHLVDSNVDWGQDLLYLKRWLREHPEARPLRIAYFPSIIGTELAGIRAAWPPVDRSSPRVMEMGLEDVGPKPGWYALSMNELHTPAGHYAYFLDFEPVARVGYSIAIFHITRDQANAVRRKCRLPAIEFGS